MTHSKTATQVFRVARLETGDADLLQRMSEDFCSGDGVKRLASVLGISSKTAGNILDGTTKLNMNRLAYHYNYLPTEQSEGWRVFQMWDEPFDAGPKMRWDNRLVEYLRAIIEHPAGSPDIQMLAWRMDTTKPRLLAAMRRHGIRSTRIRDSVSLE